MLNESAWFAMFAGVALKSSAVLAVAWLVALALRRRSAAMRHLAWTAALAAVLVLPLFSVSLPAWRVPYLGTVAPGVAALFETTATAGTDATTSSVLPRSGDAAPVKPAPWRPDWRLSLMFIWVAGAAAGLVQLLLAVVALWRVRRAASPSADGQLAVQLARALGMSHKVPVLETAEGAMPMTCGILHPAILMPRDSAHWREDRRRIVLLHELAHVRRGDVATHMLARLGLVLHWWNPLAWIAWREFLKERERATDDLVLHSGARASDYAGHLLDVARGMRSSPALASAAVAMARRSQLEGRLVAILDSRVNRKTAGRASALAAVVVAVAMVAPFSAVRAQDQATPSVPADIDATMRAAAAQKNFEMLEKPAEAFEALRQYDNAKRLLDASAAIRADVSGSQSVDYGVGLMKLGDLEKKRNRTQEAVAFYTKAAQVLGDRPEAAPALLYLGENALFKKNYPQAIEDFQKTQNLDSGLAGLAQMWMAVVREREQNPVDAERLYRAALAFQNADSAEAATTMELFARFLKEQGRDEEAQSLSARAAEIRRLPVPMSTALRIAAGITPPKVLYKVEPEYTEEARVAKYQGTVVLSVEIRPDGYADHIRVARGLGLGLDENAVTALRQWQFQPGTKDGAPVTVQATIEVNFRLL